jgi:GNAT superfamily N-acetyltransferase
MEIRKAEPSDAVSLTAIAHAAKRHWNYPERWITLWKEALTITPDFISSNQVYLAEADDKIAGFYALALEGERATLEHLWVLPERIGTGLGKKLFDHAVATARRANASFIEIESDPNAEGFYSRMGARRIGEISSELEGQPRLLPLLLFNVETGPAPGEY